MKIAKICFALIVIAGTYTSCVAQLAVGPKAGINFNTFRGDYAYDVVPGFNVGIFGKYPVLPFLKARAEILYFRQGANTYDYSVLGPDLRRTNTKLSFNNFQVPVLVELGLPSLSEDNLQPKLLLGGFYSYTFLAQETYRNVARIPGYEAVSYEGHTDVGSSFDKNQFGLIAAIAADAKILSQLVSIEFRYHYNLNQVNKPGSEIQPNLKPTTDKWGNNLYLSTLSINVGITMYHF